MSVFGPYDHFPGIVLRMPGLIDLQIRNRPEVTAYRIWGAQNVNDAYGNPTDSGVGGAAGGRKMMFQVRSGAVYRSPRIVQRRMMLDERLGQTTRAIFDINDFIEAASPQPIPHDQAMLCLRLQQKRRTTGWVEAQGAVNTGDPIMGPILLVPPAVFFGTQGPAIAFSGKAPSNTGSTNGAVPAFDPDMQTPPPMHIVLPYPMKKGKVHNLDVSLTLLVSPGLGFPMVSVPPGEAFEVDDGTVKELVLARSGDGGSCPFKVEGTITLDR